MTTTHEEIHRDLQGLTRDVESIRKEWRSTKNWMLLTVVGSVGLFVSIGAWTGSIGTQVGQHEHQLETLSTKAEDAVKVSNDVRIQLADINARIVNVEVLLTEIKEQLK